MASKTEMPKALRVQFEEAALPHLSHLYTSAYYLTKDEMDAEDLVQETYLAAFRFLDKFRPGTNCRAWLLSIMRHLFINRYRQKRREPQMVEWAKVDQVYESMVEQGEGHDAEGLFFSKLEDDEVGKALGELPEEYRTAVVLVDIEELTYDGAAEVMGCPIGTVRSRVFRGRQMLEIALRDYAMEKGLIDKNTRLACAS